MSRVWFNKGLKGMVAKRIQLDLLRAGFFEPPVEKFADGDYGNKTVTALGRLQAARGLPATGAVDEASWRQLTHESLPTLFERCLGITAHLEGHGFGLLQGNFDGAGLTWGVIGFTLNNGEIQALLKQAEQQTPGTLSRTMGPLAHEWRQVLAMPLSQQVAWADAMSSGPNHEDVPPAWRTAFARLGEEPVIKRLQMQRAYDQYFVPAVQTTAKRLQLRSELGIALAFDCHVQNGASRVNAVAALAPRAGTLPEPAMRAALAQEVAKRALPQWQADVLGRKTTLAQGGGNFRGQRFVLTSWGLNESLAK